MLLNPLPLPPSLLWSSNPAITIFFKIIQHHHYHFPCNPLELHLCHHHIPCNTSAPINAAPPLLLPTNTTTITPPYLYIWHYNNIYHILPETLKPQLPNHPFNFSVSILFFFCHHHSHIITVVIVSMLCNWIYHRHGYYSTTVVPNIIAASRRHCYDGFHFKHLILT